MDTLIWKLHNASLSCVFQFFIFLLFTEIIGLYVVAAVFFSVLN